MTALLSEEQRRIVDAPIAGPHLVDAGAGTGKTTTLVARAVALVRRGACTAPQILVATFTNAAAAEIAIRMDAAFAEAGIDARPTCVTFHGLAASLVREFAFATGDTPDLRPIEEARARVVFARVYARLANGGFSYDTSAFPFLDRPETLQRSLAKIAFRLRDLGIDVDAFERDALAAADALARLPFRQATRMVEKKRAGLVPVTGWPRPNPALSDDELAAEAERERKNVRVAATLFRAFAAELEAEGLVTFGDILRRATALVATNDGVREAVRARFRHAMIDEFQDTNPAQVAFLRALFGEDLRDVLAVGDLRQAIYEFTGARPEGIIDFAALPGVTKLPLSHNRRSYAAILAAAHHALATSEAVPPDYRTALTAVRGAGDGPCVDVRAFPNVDDEAAFVATAIRALVDAGTGPRDIAVLLRSRTKAEVFAAALRSRGLSVRLSGGLGFFEAPEIVALTAWLRLVETPQDATAIAVALEVPGIGLSQGAIALLNADGAFARAACLDPSPAAYSADERERLERFRMVARALGPLADVPLADAVRDAIAITGADVTAFAGDPLGAERVRANVEKFAALAYGLAADRPTARIADLLDEIDERALFDLDEPLAEVEGERVVISTVHGAKGLEWKHVFVANVSPRSFPVQVNDALETVVRYDEGRKALAFMYTVDGSPSLRWVLASHPIDATGSYVAEPRDDAEEHRLFYVALTRARDGLTISGTRIKTPSVCLGAVEEWLRATRGDGAGAAGGAAAFGASSDVVAALGLFDADAADERAGAREAMVARLASRANRGRPSAAPVYRQGTLSYTSLAMHEACPRRARYHYVFDLPSFDDEAPHAFVGADALQTAKRDPARFGRIVHRVLELLMLARIAGIAEELEAALDTALEEEDCGPDRSLRARARTAAAAALPLLADLTPLDVELRFDVLINGVAVGGFIDLVARDADGSLVVVDYKTGSTPGDRYALQFAVYRWALAQMYPGPIRTELLRMNDAGASREAVEPAEDARLYEAVSTARSMADDIPRPSVACGSCPYRGGLCPEGAAV